MNIDSLRTFCLSFPRATENIQWGEELCFKVGGKIFAVLGLSSVPPTLVCKCDPETFAEMTEREGIVPAPYVGRYNWISIEGLEVLTNRELQDVIRRSYTMVAAKPRSARKKAPKVAENNRRRRAHKH